MTAYARLVAKYRRLAAGAEAVQRRHPDLAIALLPHALAALAAVEAVAADPQYQAEIGGHRLELYGEAAHRYAREFAARTAAALELGNARTCPHLEGVAVPPSLVYVLLTYRQIACGQCLPAIIATDPDPADNGRCDWCGAREVTLFHPVLAPLGPCLVSGAACPSCYRALAPGGDIRPRGRG